jgi:NADH:ubiquinone oxidoreductase subunit 3 (subunit A)
MQTNWVGLAIAILGISITLMFQGMALRIQSSTPNNKKRITDTARLGIWARNVSVIFFVLALVFIVWNICIALMSGICTCR